MICAASAFCDFTHFSEKFMAEFEFESRARGMQSLSVREDGAWQEQSAGAVKYGRKMRFSVKTPFSLCSACFEIYCDDTGERRFFDMHASGENEFSLEADTASLCEESGLFYYAYHLNTEYGQRDLLCDFDTLEEKLCEPRGDGNDFFQLLIYKEREVLPSWFSGGVMYHIFVDRFFSAGGNPVRDDARKIDDWEHGMPEYPAYPGAYLENNEFFGGDLQGVAAKLDYIASLGVNTVYLSPIFRAYSNHKYDTGDYMTVDEMFGGEEALRTLISEADRRGIRIILDGVFNHTGNDSVYFNAKGRYPDVGAYQSPLSPYFPWYSFKNYPDDYESWWGIKILPRVKSDEPSYREFLFGEGGVIRKYMRMGIGGWRLDVADELSDDFLSCLSAAARSERGDALVIGEVWEDASNKISYSKRKKYFRGGELDSVMNYPMKNAVIAYIRYGNADALKAEAKRIYTHYPREVANSLMNFLGTHDTVRALTALGGASPDGKSNDELAHMKMSESEYATAKKRLMLAYLTVAMLPGVPCIYYGDEAGMQGYSDPMNRMPYPWGREDSEIRDFYRKVGVVRRENGIFADGEFYIAYADSDIAALVREKGGERITALINRGDIAHTASVDGKAEELLAGMKGDSFALEGMRALLLKTTSGAKIKVAAK